MTRLQNAPTVPSLADLHSAQDHNDLLVTGLHRWRARIVPDGFLTRRNGFRRGTSGHDVSVRDHRGPDALSARDTKPVNTPRTKPTGVELRRAQQRFLTRTDWAETHHSFSFGEHYDPSNVSFGRLLVNNDDVVRAGAGYSDHPHRDAEIVTWVLSGSLVHEDSHGNSGFIYPGLAQRMSAGSGIVHAERNDAYRIDPTRSIEPVHFVQMWIRPDESDTPPSYQQRELTLGDIAGGWVPIASGRHPDAVVSLGSAGSTLWVSVLPAGSSRMVPEGDLLHVYLVRGAVEVEVIGRLEQGDSLRVSASTQLKLSAHAEAEVLVWQMDRERGELR
jgi:redox-sensitive bicupin YhaK (pirin superfamily)